MLFQGANYSPPCGYFGCTAQWFFNDYGALSFVILVFVVHGLLLFIVFVSHVVRGLPDQAVPYDCMLWFLKAFFVMFFYQ